MSIEIKRKSRYNYIQVLLNGSTRRERIMQNDKKSPLNQSLWGKIYQVIITWIVYFLFRPKVEWVDKSVKKQLKGKPAVFVFNHTHHFDGAYTGAVLGRYKPYVLVKKSWFEKKGVGTMIGWCRCFPESVFYTLGIPKTPHMAPAPRKRCGASRKPPLQPSSPGGSKPLSSPATLPQLPPSNLSGPSIPTKSSSAWSRP